MLVSLCLCWSGRGLTVTGNGRAVSIAAPLNISTGDFLRLKLNPLTTTKDLRLALQLDGSPDAPHWLTKVSNAGGIFYGTAPPLLLNTTGDAGLEHKMHAFAFDRVMDTYEEYPFTLRLQQPRGPFII